MVDGIWRMWARRPLSVNPTVVADQAREAAAAVWARMAEAGEPARGLHSDGRPLSPGHAHSHCSSRASSAEPPPRWGTSRRTSR